MKTKILTGIALSMLITIYSCKKENASETNGLFFPKVKSIVQTNCAVSCHAPSIGLYQGLPVILETDSDIVRYGNSIKAAVADPVSFGNKRMPPSGSLTSSDIDVITNWLDKGGKITD
ncbi:MAG: hypothetical protein ABI723_23610 [Bacteroidia bacterium]